MRKGFLTIILALGILVFGVLALGACGGSSKPPSTGSGATTGAPTTTASSGGYSYGG